VRRDFGQGIGGSRGRSLSTKHDVILIAHTRIKNKLTSDLLAAASAAETSAARSTCSKNDGNISPIDHTSSHGNR
jgi:hypothetical protein